MNAIGCECTMRLENHRDCRIPSEHWIADVESLERVRSLLRHRKRHDLATLLSRASVDFLESETAGFMHIPPITIAEISAPVGDYECLKSLPKEDSERILDSLVDIWPPRSSQMQITSVEYKLDPNSLQSAPEAMDDIAKHIGRLRRLMIGVSTGGPRINSVNQEYERTYSDLTTHLNDLGIQNPVPYADLWDWYGKWSSGDLPTYASRRQYVNGLFDPIEVQLRKEPTSPGDTVVSEPTGWTRVDRTLGEARTRLESATAEEQFQAVGLLCREVLISLAQTVFDADQHPPLDDVKVSKSDAKRMLERYLAVELSGGSNAIARKHARASLDLANHMSALPSLEWQRCAPKQPHRLSIS